MSADIWPGDVNSPYAHGDSMSASLLSRLRDGHRYVLCRVDQRIGEPDDRATIFSEAADEISEAERLLRLILPLAKGYAAVHHVGSNQQYVNDAEAWLRTGQNGHGEAPDLVTMSEQKMEHVNPKSGMFVDAIRALAAIDAELGMPDDGCNSTQATLTAIRLLHSAHRDDVAKNKRLTALLSESVSTLEAFKRAGLIMNGAWGDQVNDFIARVKRATDY